jgi:translation initiation factor 5B
VLKADTLGSLEALAKMLKEKDVMIKKAAVGDISKKDTIDAEANYDKDPLKAAIIGFNVLDKSGIKNDKVKIITDTVIYQLIGKFEDWKSQQLKKLELDKVGAIVSPCKIQLMANYVFRQSNPAIIGTDILAGKLRVGQSLINKKGIVITKVKEIQLNKENKSELDSGNQAAVALENVTIGRQIHEGDILYSSIDEPDFRSMKDLKEHLSKEEKTVLKEIAEIMRQDKILWGV